MAESVRAQQIEELSQRALAEMQRWNALIKDDSTRLPRLRRRYAAILDELREKRLRVAIVDGLLCVGREPLRDCDRCGTRFDQVECDGACPLCVILNRENESKDLDAIRTARSGNRLHPALIDQSGDDVAPGKGILVE